MSSSPAVTSGRRCGANGASSSGANAHGTPQPQRSGAPSSIARGWSADASIGGPWFGAVPGRSPSLLEAGPLSPTRSACQELSQPADVGADPALGAGSL